MSAVPRDPDLPRLGLLLDAEAMAPLLARSLGRAADVGEPQLARVLYKPGDRVAVHYEVLVDGGREDAVARAVAGSDLAAKLSMSRCRELARQVDGRSPAASPVSYDARADALISWLPFDLGLPALAAAPSELGRRLAEAGVVDGEGAAEPTIVPESYKPGARIVLRQGDHVLKAYGKQHQFEHAVAGFATAASTPLRTAALEASFPDLRLTVQRAVEGLVRKPLDVAVAAGDLARRLQASRVEPVLATGPAAVLTSACKGAALTARVVPRLNRRIDLLLHRIGSTMPLERDFVPAHGDFDADQLIECKDGTLAVIDFDGVCLAPPALDLAAYVADVVRGLGDDLAALEAVRGPLLAGYGARPPALEWYVGATILSRAAHPFQRFVPGWPERVERMVFAAEEVLRG